MLAQFLSWYNGLTDHLWGALALFAALLTTRNVQYAPDLPLSGLCCQVCDAEGTLPESMLPSMECTPTWAHQSAGSAVADQMTGDSR